MPKDCINSKVNMIYIKKSVSSTHEKENNYANFGPNSTEPQTYGL